MKNKDEKKITVKSYIILGIIIIVTLLLTFYLLNWYRNYNTYKVTTPILVDVVAEVKHQELDAFLSERDITILYMCTVNENKCRSFEKKFKNYIIDNNLRDEIFYFNIGHVKDTNFLSSFYSKYKSDTLVKRVTDYPVIVVFKDNKIIDALSYSQEDKLSLDDVKNFLKDYIDLI